MPLTLAAQSSLPKQESSAFPGRYRYLQNLWQQYTACREAPQADLWLKNAFKLEKKFGKRDRLWYRDAFFQLLRLAPLYSLLQQAFAPESCFDSGSEAWLKLCQNAREQGDWQGFSQVSSEDLILWLQADRALQDAQASPTWRMQVLVAAKQAAAKEPELKLLCHGFPLAWQQSLAERARWSQWSETDTERFIVKQREQAPLWIRCRSAKAKQDLKQAIAGKDWSLLDEQELSLALAPSTGLSQLASNMLLLYEIQDLASSQILANLDLKPGARVWDVCAGGGGKTLQLLAKAKAPLELLATDIRQHKLRDLNDRLRAGGYPSVHTLGFDGQRIPEHPQFNRPFDCILIDAPCSGSGTLRRNPDAKYRIDRESLQQWRQLQSMILDTVASCLRVGGTLVYASCSLFPEENEEQITAFLQRHPRFVCQQQVTTGAPQYDADLMFRAYLSKG